MTTLTQALPPSRVGVVSYTLALTVRARRIAAKLHSDAAPFVAAAVRTYRATGVSHDGLRALRAFADEHRHGGGGLRA